MGNAAEKLVKEFRTSTETSHIVINVKSISPDIDREIYLPEKECKTCKVTLGKNASKKYYCHFCYHAVCGNCSQLTILHPETNEQERTCSLCYLKYLNEKVLEISEDFVKIKLKEEIAEREREIALRKKLVEEIENTKKSMAHEKESHSLKITHIENAIKTKEQAEINQEQENLKLKKTLEGMVIHGKISLDDYKKIDPHFVPTSQPTREPESCLKCIII
ncbi:hypothetical protein SteCoe_37797 [Stentor coeruleus]|uniref:FYVE-type domain-containing protein n=1 Tax=Stentor coeruleus TaxID=5963 RepID=A0A1R2AME3_9CILI|nr:hypothetical protein SteCoe_37797 [Stentor coeruleus]